LGAYLKQYTGLEEIVITQGVEMGCPSELRVGVSDGIVVSGDVQIVGDGTLTLP
jgi:predicted PhzF superfamily epimerase YddE/YHI9